MSKVAPHLLSLYWSSLLHEDGKLVGRNLYETQVLKVHKAQGLLNDAIYYNQLIVPIIDKASQYSPLLNTIFNRACLHLV